MDEKIIGLCPKCKYPISPKCPYSWCEKCGEHFSENIKIKLNNSYTSNIKNVEDMKTDKSNSKKNKGRGIEKFILCFVGFLLVFLYASGTAGLNWSANKFIGLNYFYICGILLILVYSWLVVKCKNIYPVASQAIWHLCLTFLITGLSAKVRTNEILKVVNSNPGNATQDMIDRAVFFIGYSRLSSFIFWTLILLFLILKLIEYRSKATANMSRE